jgi:ADP-ribosyl-[dinitrogen reductase] hydrolase
VNDTLFEKIKSNIFGISVGDAFGVPFEFLSRSQVQERISSTMVGFGTHDQPPGTWSDDTSLTLGLMNGLSQGYDLKKIMDNYLDWLENAAFTAGNVTFDVGLTTRRAILNYKDGNEPLLCGESGEYSNGNGSLMRISPLPFYLFEKNIDERRRISFEISGLTHGHIRSKIACWLMVEILTNIIRGSQKKDAVDVAFASVGNWVKDSCFNSEWSNFHRCNSGIIDIPEDSIKSTTFVIDSLEASLWSFLRANTFEDAIISAVSLGEDTDTVGSITGSLAGLFYGFQNIPYSWYNELKGKEIIEKQIKQFYNNLPYKTQE